jgi:hypothetical protein
VGALKDNTPEGLEENFMALNVPKQCPYVLQIEIHLRQGKASGSEKDKVSEHAGLCFEQRRDVERGL